MPAEPRQDERTTDAEFWSGEWAALASKAAAAINAADGLLDAMQGKLGPDQRAMSREDAAAEILRRIERWTETRAEVAAYIAAVKSALEQVVARAEIERRERER